MSRPIADMHTWECITQSILDVQLRVHIFSKGFSQIAITEANLTLI